MTVVTTIDVYDMPNSEYRAVLDRREREPGLTTHHRGTISAMEEDREVQEFAQRRCCPPQGPGDRKTEIT